LILRVYYLFLAFSVFNTSDMQILKVKISKKNKAKELFSKAKLFFKVTTAKSQMIRDTIR